MLPARIRILTPTPFWLEMKYPDPSRQAEPKAVIKITPRISRESELNNVFEPGTDQPFRESRHVYDGCGHRRSWVPT